MPPGVLSHALCAHSSLLAPSSLSFVEKFSHRNRKSSGAPGVSHVPAAWTCPGRRCMRRRKEELTKGRTPCYPGHRVWKSECGQQNRKLCCLLHLQKKRTMAVRTHVFVEKPAAFSMVILCHHIKANIQKLPGQEGGLLEWFREEISLKV